MDAKVEVTPMTVASTMLEAVVVAHISYDIKIPFRINRSHLTFAVPSIAGHSISAITPDFTLVGGQATLLA